MNYKREKSPSIKSRRWGGGGKMRGKREETQARRGGIDTRENEDYREAMRSLEMYYRQQKGPC